MPSGLINFKNNDYPHTVPQPPFSAAQAALLSVSFRRRSLDMTPCRWWQWNIRLFFKASVLSFVAQKKVPKKMQSYRQRQRPAGIALILTVYPCFFRSITRRFSCQKRRSLLRRDHPLRSGVPRGRPAYARPNRSGNLAKLWCSAALFKSRF